MFDLYCERLNVIGLRSRIIFCRLTWSPPSGRAWLWEQLESSCGEMQVIQAAKWASAHKLLKQTDESLQTQLTHLNTNVLIRGVLTRCSWSSWVQSFDNQLVLGAPVQRWWPESHECPWTVFFTLVFSVHILNSLKQKKISIVLVDLLLFELTWSVYSIRNKNTNNNFKWSQMLKMDSH